MPDIPPWRSLWAKSAPHHPLWCHLIDVGHVASLLWDEVLSAGWRGHLARRLGLSEQAARNLVVWLTALHDIGKATPQFQCMEESLSVEAKSAGFSFPKSLERLPHGDASGQILMPLLAKAWGEISMANRAARAAAGHHGFPPFQITENWHHCVEPGGSPSTQGHSPLPWRHAQGALIRLVENALGLTTPASPGAPHAAASLAFIDIAGFISFADWIGSSEKHFAGCGSQGGDIDAYTQASSESAKKALAQFGWSHLPTPSRAADYATLFGGGEAAFAPRPLQRRVAEILTERPRTRFLLIEAPTGEGKTEAALYAAAHWLREFQQRGVYLALPTQATSNAMHQRFVDWFKRLDIGKHDVLLLHSGFIKPEQYEEMIARTISGAGRIYDSEDGSDSAATAHEWFLQAKRGLLAPFAVGTIDQALLGVLLCRHHFVRLHGLAGKTVIFDEVHAYDAYTGTLLDRLLEYLGALGCTVILLSATLPGQRRRDLARAFAGREIAAVDGEAAYPRIIALGDEGLASSDHIETSEDGRKTIALDWLPPDMDAALGALADRLGQRGCTAWVFNTVRHAQEAYRKAKELGRFDEVHILHSRFTAGERQDREARLLGAFGKDGSKRPKGRALVVASQVIEQSLDVDFDLMASDLAPIDLLLQRSGRLHRHRSRQRPPHLTEPRLLVRRPCEESTVPPAFGRTVYAESILMRTLALLERKRELHVPEEVEGMIEEVYGGAVADHIPSRWQDSLREKHAETIGLIRTQNREAQKRMIHPARKANSYWDLAGELEFVRDEDDAMLHSDFRPLTRLADESMRVLCLHSRNGRLYLDHACRERVSDHTPDAKSLRLLLRNVTTISARHLGGFSNRDRRERLEYLTASCVAPVAWQRHGILRYLPLLRFEDGAFQPPRGPLIQWHLEVGFQYIYPQEKEASND